MVNSGLKGVINRSYIQLNALKLGIYSHKSIGFARFHVQSKPRLLRPS